jgi:ABC-2 type transport system permease protein
MMLPSLFAKSVREQVREPLVMAGVVLMGAAFMVIFGLAMGTSLYTYAIAVRGGTGSKFVEALRNAGYPDGVRLFDVRLDPMTEDLTPALRRRDLAAIVRIPEGFPAAVEALSAGRSVTATAVEVRGDPGNPAFGLVEMMIRSTLDEYLVSMGQPTQSIHTQTSYLEGGPTSGGEFTYMAPGLMLMAIFMLLIQCAMVIVREVQSGTMLRLRLAGVPTGQFLGAVGLSQVLFAGLMLPLMYATARLMGLPPTHDLFAELCVGLLASTTAIAFGLVTAAVSRTVIEAFLWGNLATIPVVFLSGAFFPLPRRALFSVFHLDVNLLDWIPSNPAVSAMSEVLLRGAGLTDVWWDILKMLVASAGLFALGAFLFSRTHLRRI